MINWAKNHLVPVVAQEVNTKEVLMVAYADQAAFERTIETGYAHYFSRSRNALWKKGETSGHTQKIVQVLSDCDGDTLLYIVEQTGAACHTLNPTCFFTNAADGTSETVQPSVITRLTQTISERKNGDPKSSYVASLFAKGSNTICKKVIEEAGELTFALKDHDHDQIVYEAADLLFHILVALSSQDISPREILAELARREGQSGITEKEQRNSH
ncbi:histidine biosynthesis bifunctional protein HisIE [Campylobacterota bacterium]|nr:histidine biosynthesis bifunctional protein HisIE [Campylobacterota bacterium]